MAFGFCLCSLLATAATRTVHVRGTIGNLHELGLKGWYSALNIRSVGWLVPASGPDPATKQFNGTLECKVVRNAHGKWVDIELTAMAYVRGRDRSMFIRVPYAHTIDLGTFEWKPSHYRWKDGALVIDTGVPRDTAITDDQLGTRILLQPVNPAPQDSIIIELEWPSSGAAHLASYTMAMKDCCTVLIDFTFAVRTDVDVYGESWPQRAKPFVLPKLEAGRYRLRQVLAQGENLRDVDFLLGTDLYFTVGERTEP